MKHLLLANVLAAAILAVSCGTAEPSHDHGHGHATVQAADKVVAEVDHRVQLDHGHTWAANAETTAGIAAMQALVGNFDPAQGDATLLKEGLTAAFKGIFAKCTMTGEAHDQLHNYLIPLKGMLDDLGAVPDAAQLQALGQYLGTYKQYFH